MSHDQRPGRMRVVKDPSESDRRGNAVSAGADTTAMVMAAMTPKGAAALSMALARKSARAAAVAPPQQVAKRR